MKDKRNLVICVIFENTDHSKLYSLLTEKLSLDFEISDIANALGASIKENKWSEVFTLSINRDLPFKESVSSIAGFVKKEMEKKGANFFAITSISEINYQE